MNVLLTRLPPVHTRGCSVLKGTPLSMNFLIRLAGLFKLTYRMMSPTDVLIHLCNNVWSYLSSQRGLTLWLLCSGCCVDSGKRVRHS